MTWGCITRGKTPAMIRTGYDLRRKKAKSPGGELAGRPDLTMAFEGQGGRDLSGRNLTDSGDGSAFARCIRDVDARRIAVR